MENIQLVYIALSVIFAAVMAYMYLYTTHLHPSERCPTYETYGLLDADLVRHVARAFDVGEEDVWQWVDKERHHPTTKITNPS